MKAVVFDVDGTLVDSERDGHRVAFNSAFASLGLPDRWDPTTYGELLAVTGGRQRLEAWLVSQGHNPGEARCLAEKLHALKTARFRAMAIAGDVPARAGAVALVRWLHATGVSLHIATTGSRTWVEPLLDHHFGLRTFTSVVTGTEVRRLKPDPAVYLEVLRKSGLKPTEAMALEDSANGLRAAVAAELPCVVVCNDYTRDHDFTGAALVGTGPDDPQVVEFIARLISAQAMRSRDRSWPDADGVRSAGTPEWTGSHGTRSATPLRP